MERLREKGTPRVIWSNGSRNKKTGGERIERGAKRAAPLHGQ
jgi:hypothetical protein